MLEVLLVLLFWWTSLGFLFFVWYMRWVTHTCVPVEKKMVFIGGPTVWLLETLIWLWNKIFIK